MDDLAVNKNAPTDDGEGFLDLLARYQPASNAHLQNNETLQSLADLLKPENLLFVNDVIAPNGHDLPTANSVAAVLHNADFAPTNAAIYPLDEQQPFTLHAVKDEAFVIGTGKRFLAFDDLEAAVILADCLADNGRQSDFTIIVPFHARQFESVVKAHAKTRHVEVFTLLDTARQYANTLKGENVTIYGASDFLPLLIRDLEGDIDALISDEQIHNTTISEWGEVAPLTDTSQINDNPYPLKAFTPELQDVIQRAAYFKQTPMSAAGQAVLGALSTMLQGLINSPYEDSHNPTSLFLITELDSGGGKTQLNKYIYKAIREKNQQLYELYEHNNSLYNAEIAALSPKEKRQYIADHPKPIDHSFMIKSGTLQYVARKFVVDGKHNLAITSGEAGQMMGSHAMRDENIHSTIGTFADLYSGEEIEYNTSGNAKDTGKTKAFDRRLTIDLAGQPPIIKPILTNTLLMQQGFMARFLISCEPSLVGKRKYDDDERNSLDSENDPIMIKFWERCKDLLDRPPINDGKAADGTPERYNMPFGDGAKRYLNAYRQHCENRLLSTFQDHQQTAQRLAENASRIATLFAYFDGLTELPIDYLQRGVLLAEYSIHELMRYNDQSTRTQLSNNQKLWAYIVKKCKQYKTDTINRTTIYNGCPEPMRGDTRKLQQELDALESAGYIQQTKKGRLEQIKANKNFL